MGDGDRAARLSELLGGLGGAPPVPGRLYVVAVPRFSPAVASIRAAVVLAGADSIRVATELPIDALAGCSDALRVRGALASLDPIAEDVAGRVVVQLIATAVQTAPAVVASVTALRTAGTPVEVVASTGEVDAALVAGGIGPGIARAPQDGRLDVAIVAADRADLDDWRAALVRRGFLAHTPVTIVQRAGTAAQQAMAMTLKELAGLDVPGPVLAIVGDDVAGPESWRDDLPLAGRTVLNARAAGQAAGLSAQLRSLGADVVEAPAIEVTFGSADDHAMLDAVVAELPAAPVGLLGLTSTNGVLALAASLARCGLDARALGSVTQIAVVGPGTASALWERLRLRPDVIAGTQHGAGLVAAVGAPAATAHALLLRGDLAGDVVPDGLTAAGWEVTNLVGYRTTGALLPATVLDALAAGALPLVPVLSASMAHSLVTQARERGAQAAFVSIGPSTSAALRALDVEPIAEADSYDLAGLVAALCRVAQTLG